MMPRMEAGAWSMTSESGLYAYYLWTPTHEQDRWKASWNSLDGRLSDTRKGMTLDSVLKIFPTKISDKFRIVVARELV